MFALFPPLGLVQQILDLVGVVNAVELDNARHRVNDGRHLAVDFLLVAQYGILVRAAEGVAGFDVALLGGLVNTGDAELDALMLNLTAATA